MATQAIDGMQVESAEAQASQSQSGTPQEDSAQPTPAFPVPQPGTAPTESGGTTPTQFAAPLANSISRTATPTRPVNGTNDIAPSLPIKAASHGAPTRRYLNEKVTGVLLEGMKKLAAEQPEEPLRVLGEYLLQKSEEIEKR